MEGYLDSTCHASKSLIDLVYAEALKLSETMERLGSLRAKHRVFEELFARSDVHEDFSEPYVQWSFAQVARARQERTETEEELAALMLQVEARRPAIQALAGAVLQIAKQGISSVHGQLANAPLGRQIGSLHLRDIVWQARNQSMHFDDETPHPPVSKLFATLAKEHGDEYALDLHKGRSRAKEILDLLEWRTYDAYRTDMESLA